MRIHLEVVVISGVVETAALKLGGTVATHGLKSWMQRRVAKRERDESLAEVAVAEISGPLQRLKFTSLESQITSEVAEQLAPMLSSEFSGIPTHEFNAAIQAAADLLASADLSDDALWAVDANPELLARKLRSDFPDQARVASLSVDASELYERALDWSCRYLIQVLRHLSPFTARALQEVLTRLSSQSEQLADLLSRVPRSSLLAPHGTDQDEEFRIRYLTEIEGSLDRLELLGVPTVDQPPLALTVAYLSLTCSDEENLSHAPPRRRFVGRGWTNRFEPAHRADSVSVETAIGGATRVLLRGDAGSGKTTLLNWLAVQAARERFQGDLAAWNGKIPFLVTLRSYGDGKYPKPDELLEYTAPNSVALMPVGWAHRQFDTGRALLLVDGVDEVEKKHRSKVKAWLRRLLDSFPGVHVVVTSRPGAADPLRLAEERFKALTLDPMSQANIETFVERWHGAAAAASPRVDAQARHRKMLRQLERRHIRELATSPLLCAMLCALNFAHHGDLPDNRMDVYDKALAMLIHLRDAERQIPSLVDGKVKEVILRDLAWRHTLGGRVESRHDEAVGHVALKLKAIPGSSEDPEVVLTHLVERSGVLRSPVQGRIDFVHRTFQEYLAAEEAIEQDYIDPLIKHAHLDTWAQTIVMACGHANAVQKVRLLAGILDRADNELRTARGLRLLAAQCLETVRDLEPGVLGRIEDTIGDHLVPPVSRVATQSLASVGHHILRYLPTEIEELSSAVSAATVRAAVLTGSPDAIPLLSRYARDPRSAVQNEIAEGWLYFEPEMYVDEVLGNAPLRGGAIHVSQSRLLPYVGRLRNLTSLAVSLVMFDPHDDFPDLRCLDGVPNLELLTAYFNYSELDLSPLRDHQNLETLSVYGRKNLNVSTLSQLKKLRRLYLQTSDWRHDNDPSFLADVKDLEVLHLSPFVDVGSARRIGGLESLKSLGIGPYSDKALNAIGSSSVSSVTLQIPKDSESLGRVVKTFPDMRALHIDDFSAPSLEDLVGTKIESLEVMNAVTVDLSPVVRMRKLKSLRLHSTTGMKPIDLLPLAEMRLKLHLAKGGEYLNRDRLASGVRIRSSW